MNAPLDPFGLDPAFRAKALPAVRLLFEKYWRVEVEGLEYVPADGAALLLGNHSGALPIDAVMVASAIAGADGNGRVARPLYDRFVAAQPSVDRAWRRLGGVPASYRNADTLLGRGQLVVSFPEGVAGVSKLFRDRYRLRPFATSPMRLSWIHRVPILPFSVIGAEEAHPVIARSRRVGKMVGAPYMPVTPWFPWLGPIGAVPLPTKWKIRFGPPIHLYRERRFRADVAPDFRAMADRVRGEVLAQLADQLASRRSIFFG